MNFAPRKFSGIDWIVAGMLVAATSAAFAPACNGGFLQYDDDGYVTGPRLVWEGITLTNVAGAFTSFKVSNWHPVTWLSLMTDCQLYGLVPWGFHLTSILLHSASAGVLYVALRRATGARWRSALAAGLVALHPLRVESVAWIAERKDVLSMFLGMGSLLAYIRYTREPLRGVLFVGVGTLAMMAKAMLVTLPVLFLLVDFWPLQRNQVAWQRRVLEKVPLMVVAAVVSAFTWFAQQASGAMIAVGRLPPQARVENALVAYVRYIVLSMWPSGLAAYYPFPAAEGLTVRAAGAAAILAVISGLAILWRQRYPYLLVGWFWYLVTLVPVIGLVQVGAQAMADRYAYLPHVGLALVGAWGLSDLARARPGLRPALIGGAAAALMACIVTSQWQIAYWHDDKSLWSHALDVTYRNYVAHNGLGLALLDAGDRPGAIREFTLSAQLNSGYAEAPSNLGRALAESGDFEGAVRELSRSLRLSDNPRARANLGRALALSGRQLEAERELRRALQADPALVEARSLHAEVLARQGDWQGAGLEFQRVLRQTPADPNVHNGYGLTLKCQGRLEDAVREYETALRLAPGHAEALQNLAVIRAERGDLDGAEAYLRRAVLTHPADADARYGLGALLVRRNKPADAVQQLRLALQGRPDMAGWRFEVAFALAEAGQAQAAATEYERARRQAPGWPEQSRRQAWRLATAPDAGLRNATEALLLAREALSATVDKSAPYLDTLAAALAAAGHFDEAVATAQHAARLAKNVPNAQAIRARAALYASRRAYRQTGSLPQAP